MGRLGILVNSDRHLQHAVGFVQAARARGHDLSVFVMDTGTHLLRDAAFVQLASIEGVKLTLCQHSAAQHGVETEALPSTITRGSQLNNAMMLHTTDRVIVLQPLEALALKMLFLLTDGLVTAPGELLETLVREHEVEVVDLARPDISYEVVVDKIFDADKIISW